MARRPNYKFERMERDRAKVAKKAARAAAKAEKVEVRRADDPDAPLSDAPPPAEEATGS